MISDKTENFFFPGFPVNKPENILFPERDVKFIRAFHIVMQFERKNYEKNFGIKPKILSERKRYYDRFASELIHNIEKPESILYEFSWIPSGCHEYPWKTAICIFDFSVHSGRCFAIQTAQKTIKYDFGLDITIDGCAGYETRSILSQIDSKKFIKAYHKRRISFMKSLKNWKKNYAQWMHRVEYIESCSREPYSNDLDFLPKKKSVKFNDEKICERAKPKNRNIKKSTTVVAASAIGIFEAIETFLISFPESKLTEFFTENISIEKYMILSLIILILIGLFICHLMRKESENWI